MLIKILSGISVVLLVLILVIALRPSDFRVSRSITVLAPVSVVFPQVNDLHAWENWSPWAKVDPAMKTSYEGAPAGEGASYRWSGNSAVGEGRSTIVESQPHERIRFKLQFVRPFAGTNDVVFSFKSEGEQTIVTWTMTGKYNFMCKAVGLVVDCGKMCGGQFEQGLATLKSVVESAETLSAAPHANLP